MNEYRNPALLKMIDRQFEMEFPLQHTKLKFHTKVRQTSDFRYFLRPHSWIHFRFRSQQYREIASEMRNYYFGDKHIDNRTLQEFSKMMSDIWFNYGIDLSARIQANKSNADTFFYK